MAVFVLGLFWKKTTNKAAIWGALLSIPVAVLFKGGGLPWMDQMGLTALITMLIIIAFSLVQNKGENDVKGIELKKGVFNTSPLFNVGAFSIMIVLVALYSLFW